MLTLKKLENVVKNCFQNSNILNNKVVNKVSKPKFINKSKVKVVEINNNGCSYLMLPVNQDINIIEKAISKLVLPSYENYIQNANIYECYSNENISINLKKVQNNNESVSFNEYYQNFKRIKLNNGLVVLYEVKEVYKVENELKLDEKLLNLEENEEELLKELANRQEFSNLGIESFTIEISIIYREKEDE